MVLVVALQSCGSPNVFGGIEMALCGKNDALTGVTDKIADIEKEITAKLDSTQSDIYGSLDTKLTRT